MPIFAIDGRKILFIHVPKTGGSAIAGHLSRYGEVSLDGKPDQGPGMKCIPRHLHGAPLEEMFKPADFDYVFTVVRHPLSRVISDYRYYVRRKGRENTPPRFSMWLRYRLFRASLDPYYQDNHFRAQSAFPCLGAEIYRFENGLSRCIEGINGKLGTAIPAELPWVNRSPPIPVHPSRADKALIYRRYRRDFERFGYEME